MTRAAAILSKLPPGRHFAVPPLGMFCLCGPCAIIQFDDKVVALLTWLLKQYTIVAPSVAVLRLWFELQQDDSLINPKVFRFGVSGINLISVLLAVWALFVLFK
jgi:hypothetical protein